MTTRVKLNQRDRASASSADHLMDKISESKFRRNPIVLYVLASVLVHAIGLVFFTLIEPLEPRVQMVPKKAPIDFVVVPPEESSSKTPTDPLPQEQTQTNQEIEPEPPTPEKIAPPSQALAVPESAPTETPPPKESPAQTPPQPEPPSQTVAVPEPIPESAPTETPPPKELPAEASPQPEPPSQTVAVPEPIPESAPTETPPPKELPAEAPPQPEPVTPPSPSNILAENQNSSEILSGSDPVVEETEIKTPEINKLAKPPIDGNESEDSSRATRLPPKITPTTPLATEQPVSPATEPENSSRATRLPPKITPTTPLATEQPVSPPSSPDNIPATSRASLLGGNLKRSFEDDGGDSFFNLENNSSQQAYNPALDAQQSIDMRKYFSEIQRRVKRNWNPKHALKEYTTVLTFSIQRNGQITLLAVRRTSGSQEVDREALEAVQDSAPFDPLPANFPLDEINVEFNFNIYIY